MASTGWQISSSNTGVVFESKDVSSMNPANLTVTGSIVKFEPTTELDIIGANVGIGTTNPQHALDVVGNVSTSGSYKIGATDVLTSTTLGSTVVNSSLTSVGTLTSLSITGDLTVDSTTLRVISGTNRVGINVSSPAVPLHVVGSGNTIRLSGDDSSYMEYYAKELATPGVRSGYIGYALNTSDDLFIENEIQGGNLRLYTMDSGGVRKYCQFNSQGYFGVSVTTALYPLHVAGSATANVGSGTSTIKWFNQANSTLQNTDLTSEPIAVYAINGSIWTTQKFVASSDARIKENIAAIDDGEALEKLRLLNPVSYNYVDKVSRTSAKVYGFIAQEVKEVLPYAVSQEKEVIPNIFTTGSVTNQCVTIDKPHGLNPGDKVRIIKYSDENPYGNMFTVATTPTITSFTVSEDCESPMGVFVYGKEVNDFNVLDKNAIFTINVAATQELDRTVQSLISIKNDLLTRVSNLELKINSQTTA